MEIGPYTCDNDLTVWIKVSEQTLGCKNPADTVRCEIVVSSYSEDQYLDYEFDGFLTQDPSAVPRVCKFEAATMYLSTSVTATSNA